MIIFLDMLFIIGMLIFGIAFIKLVLDNILLIILAIVVIIAMVGLFIRWPKQTLIILLVLIVVVFGGTYISHVNEENSVTVTIYKATGECAVYDIDHNVVTIPSGAMIARYTDESERQSESVGNISYAGFTDVCCWYYNGKVYSFYESWAMDSQSNWNTQMVEKITYKEFKNSDWWVR